MGSRQLIEHVLFLIMIRFMIKTANNEKLLRVVVSELDDGNYTGTILGGTSGASIRSGFELVNASRNATSEDELVLQSFGGPSDFAGTVCVTVRTLNTSFLFMAEPIHSSHWITKVGARDESGGLNEGGHGPL